MSFSKNYLYSFHPVPFFTDKISFTLAKQRIIQKNLVHFQGFPDSFYNENLLASPEYLGQYGTIIKISLASKDDKVTHKRVNSAYITFETNEQAAYCILAIDSIKIDNQIVRAFFGTTKYCNHFLNNFHCFNEEKCMFLHHLADPSDIIDENKKFGYNEHINLAKKIIGYGSLKSKLYVSNNNFHLINSVLPSIKTIYNEEDTIIKNVSHKRQLSNLSNSSTTNNSINGSRNRNLSESSSKEKDKNNSNENNNNTSIGCFKYKRKSRFFNNINNEYDIYNTYDSKNLSYIVDNLCERMSFFIYFKKFNQLKLLKELEIEFCKDLYKKINDNDIKLILENNF